MKVVVLVPATEPDVNDVVTRVLVMSGGCETVFPTELVIVGLKVTLVELVVAVDDTMITEDVLLVVVDVGGVVLTAPSKVAMEAT